MGPSMRLLVERLHCPKCVAALNALDTHIASHRRQCYRDDEVQDLREELVCILERFLIGTVVVRQTCVDSNSRVISPTTE
jgi:hypothetical protein